MKALVLLLTLLASNSHADRIFGYPQETVRKTITLPSGGSVDLIDMKVYCKAIEKKTFIGWSSGVNRSCGEAMDPTNNRFTTQDMLSYIESAREEAKTKCLSAGYECYTDYSGPKMSDGTCYGYARVVGIK